MCRTKITVQSGAQRHPKDAEAAGWSALDGDLGSAQDWSAGRMAVSAWVRSAGVTAASLHAARLPRALAPTPRRALAVASPVRAR